LISIIIMAASSVERVRLIRILNVVISAVEVATMPGVVESVTSYGEPSAFLFLLLWFVISDYFSVSDLYVFRDVFQCDEETCIGSWDVLNALEQAAAFVAKTLGLKWLETGILHESRVFHFFSGDWVDDCVGMVPL
jgi:hypothetical protein